VACAARPVVVASVPPAPVCPLEGCDAARAHAIEVAASPDACAAAGDAPCSGASPAECTAHALDAWSDAQDERGVACVARVLLAACELGDAQGCGFAGRLVLDGRGVSRDVQRGIGLLDRACSDGDLVACRVAVRWLADADHVRDLSDATFATELRARLDLQLDCLSGVREGCQQLALGFTQGRDGFSRDLSRAAAANQRGCALGDRIACNNLGDAYEYGDGVARDLSRAAALYDRACHIGEALGCANLGHLVENGEGVPRDVPRARGLYRDACAAGDNYGCLHEQMATLGSPSTPEEAQRALARWQRACDGNSAQACTFVGLLYEDGPDGFQRDERRSLAAMERACTLDRRDKRDKGSRACAWVQARTP
jgi:TPR repeat protein